MKAREQDDLGAPGDRARFEASIVPEPNTGCWIWVGAYDMGGYGRFWSGTKTMKAHRASWHLNRGPVPQGMLILHSCIGMRACVNPGHLRVGTHAENMADRGAQGRAASGPRARPHNVARGERNKGGGKLTTDDVMWIRGAFAAGGVSKGALARKYGVSHAMVRMILERKAWSHV